MLLTRLLPIALCLAACATRQPTPPQDPDPATPLARAAVAEWRAWGRVVIDGWPDARPSDTTATEDRFTRLLEYWNTIPGGYRIAQRHAGLRSGLAAMEQRLSAETGDDDGAVDSGPMAIAGIDDMSLYENPAWSAAFISTVARRAFVPESDLPSSSRHARYLDTVLTRAATDPENAPFRPHAPEEYVPVPGDLLCADRAYAPLMHWTQRLAERGRPRPMHCDVVVRTMPGTIEAVGGNVQGMVALRRFPSDEAGHVLPAPYRKPVFIVVLENREGAAPAAVAAAE